jgi:hypothetical protein
VHGSIFTSLEKYANTRFGPGGFARLCREAGLGDRIFLTIRLYPDDEAFALIGAASRMSSIDVHVLLEDFGAFLARDLMSMYGMLADPSWRTLDFLVNVDDTIHRVVRLRNPGAQPPELHCERVGPGEVVLHYASSRRLCDLARGLIRGVAAHYGETVSVIESDCMHRGARQCRIVARLEGTNA